MNFNIFCQREQVTFVIPTSKKKTEIYSFIGTYCTLCSHEFKIISPGENIQNAKRISPTAVMPEAKDAF